MYKAITASISLSLILSFTGLPAWAQSTQPSQAQVQKVSAEEIQKLVDQMGGDDYEEREAATEALWQLGNEAEEALKEALKSNNAEVVWRAKEILTRLSYGIQPDTPKEVLDIITAFRNIAERDDREAKNTRTGHFRDLIEIGEAGFEPYIRLLQIEKYSDVKGTAIDLLDASAFRFTRQAIKAKDYPKAAKIYQQMAIHGSNVAAQQYITFLAKTGQLKAELRNIERLGMKYPKKSYMVVLAYLALNQPARAIELASLEDDRGLYESLLIDQGQWQALKPTIDLAELPDQLQLGTTFDLTRQAMLAQFLYQTDEYNSIAKLLYEAINAQPERVQKDMARIIAMHLLYLGEVSQARSLMEEYDLEGYASFQETTLQLNSALDLNSKALENSNGNDFIPLAMDLIRMNERLGNKDKAIEVLDALDKDLTGHERNSNIGLLVTYYRQVGKTDRANELIHKMIEDHSDEPYMMRDFMYYLYNTALQSELAFFWMERLRSQQNLAKPELIFTQMDQLLKIKMEKVNVKSLIQTEAKRIEEELKLVQRDFERIRLYQQYLWLADTWELYGDLDETAQIYQRSAELFPQYKDNAEFGVARMLMLQNQYQAAGELMEKVFESSEDLKILGLAAQAYRMAGLNEQADELAHQYDLLVLNDSYERYQLVLTLRSLKQDEAAYQQIGKISEYLAIPNSIDLVNNDNNRFVQQVRMYRVYKQLIADEYLKPRGRWAEAELAVNIAEFSKYRPAAIRSPRFFDQTFGVIERGSSTRLGIHIASMVKAGKVDQASKKYLKYIKANPNAIDFSIDVLSAMKNTGHEKKAEELFTQLAAQFQPYIEGYPGNAMDRNNLSWVSATSHVGMKQALVWSTKSVELEPSTTAYMDTLAEIKFQMGDTPGALELMKKCVEAEPFKRYYRAQYERMKKGDPKVPCPRHITD